ncbi:tetratricopeptide repeat protein [Actinoplanes sp. GCM10030250]|uniref:tetratricopeptide repeat protein n=1 Tax=Actinoplanes sp. GCM10030250 TaxID=3273376 RepID=UPI003613E191
MSRTDHVASDLDALVPVAEQHAWMASAPADTPAAAPGGRDTRPDNEQQPTAGRAGFDRLAADPRFDAMIPVLRRYLARTIPFPRRTELSRWSVSASTGKNLVTVTVHSQETLSAYAPAGQPHRTIFALHVDAAALHRRWSTPERLAGAFPAVFFEQTRPGLLRLEVEGARTLMRLLDVDGVVDAARRLNLDMMRRGPAVPWRTHHAGLADRLLEPATEPAGAPFPLGLFWDRLGDVPRAEHHYRLAGGAEAAFRLGELLIERGDAGAAQPCYEQAAAGGYHGVRRPPRAADTHANTRWGRHCSDSGAPADAAWYFKLAAEGGASQAYVSLGDVFTQLGEFDRAKSAYRSAAACGHRAGWYGLARVHDAAGETTVAQSWYRRAAEAGHPAAMVETGWAHESRGELPQAEIWYRRGVRAGDLDALVQLGDLLARRGDTAGAAACYQRAIRRGSGAGLVGLGILHENDGEHTEAEACYRRALDRGRTQALNNLGTLYTGQGDLKRAKACFRDAVTAGHSDGHLHLGDLLDEQGQHDAAERQYRQAAAAGNHQAVARLGTHYLHLGELDAAEPLLRVAAGTADPAAMYDLSLLLHQRGLPDEAQTWLHRAAQAGHTPALEHRSHQLIASVPA